LLNTTYNIFSKILYAKLLPYIEKVTGNYQSGSALNPIHTLRQILEKVGEFSIESHHLFINFSSAYDSINRNQLFAATEEFRIPDKIVRLVKATMENSQCHVRVQSELLDLLRGMNGLRQGDSLVCLLFNIALEKGIRDSGIQIRGTIFVSPCRY
jgi:sorting nexin-29